MYVPYHSVEVNEVEITDTASWLVPTKEDSMEAVDTGQCKTSTGRRSSSSECRGGPETCRRLYINVCTFNQLDYDYLD